MGTKTAVRVTIAIGFDEPSVRAGMPAYHRAARIRSPPGLRDAGHSNWVRIGVAGVPPAGWAVLRHPRPVSEAPRIQQVGESAPQSTRLHPSAERGPLVRIGRATSQTLLTGRRRLRSSSVRTHCPGRARRSTPPTHKPRHLDRAPVAVQTTPGTAHDGTYSEHPCERRDPVGAAPAYQRHPLPSGRRRSHLPCPSFSDGISPLATILRRLFDPHGARSPGRLGSSVEMTTWVNRSPLSNALTTVLRSPTLRTRSASDLAASGLPPVASQNGGWGLQPRPLALQPSWETFVTMSRYSTQLRGRGTFKASLWLRPAAALGS